MAGGAPGTSSRGRGGKFKKYTRGGGHHFSRDLQPLDSEGNAISMWGAGGAKKDAEDSDEEEEDSDSEEEESDDDEAEAKPSAAANDSREDRKALKKARKEAAIARQKGKTVEVGDLPSSDEESSEEDEDDMPANPNHSKAARKQAAKPITADEDDDEVDEVTDGVKKLQPMSRKERDAAEAAAAKERYMKLHHQGKTDEAKADLERLKLIREKREAESARRQAEKEEREAQETARRAEFEAKEAKKRAAAAGPKKGKKK